MLFQPPSLMEPGVRRPTLNPAGGASGREQATRRRARPTTRFMCGVILANVILSRGDDEGSRNATVVKLELLRRASPAQDDGATRRNNFVALRKNGRSLRIWYAGIVARRSSIDWASSRASFVRPRDA